MPLSDPDYYSFDRFVGTVLKRLSEGKCSVLDAKADIMHPFTALDAGNEQEFVPWMQILLDRWEDEQNA